ncbi:hypothetical protein ISN44_As09g008580 [Arabidopsis suecica]|uniref:Uncharacterized protein n=1 Tax=Arabidopsis suecica TaxID=45249 RepID=A0A8T2AI87_ARASU|nr:hypothetical protein ISN44_As09g008580 [Arabidopsis suecica]
MIRLSLSKEPNVGFKAAMEHMRSTEMREEDNRFKPPDLDQDQHQDSSSFILINEGPPNEIFKSKLKPTMHRPFKAFRIIQNQDYTIDLQGKHNLSSSFEVSDLVLSNAEKSDLRSNPFQVGEDDVILESIKDLECGSELEPVEQHEARNQLEPEEQHEPEDELVAADVLLKKLIKPPWIGERAMSIEFNNGRVTQLYSFSLVEFCPNGFSQQGNPVPPLVRHIQRRTSGISEAFRNLCVTFRFTSSSFNLLEWTTRVDHSNTIRDHRPSTIRSTDSLHSTISDPYSSRLLEQNPIRPSETPTRASLNSLDLRYSTLLQGQAAGAIALDKKMAEIHNKVDCSFNDLNIKFEALNSRLKYVERQIASTSAPKNPGQLPGKAIQNPKEYVNAIRLRSGRELQARPSPAPVTEDSEIQEGEDLIHNETQVEDTTKLDQDAVPSDQAKSPQIKTPVVDKGKKKAFIPPPYKPKIPFPGRFKKDIIEKYRAMFARHIKEIEVRMPLIDAYKLIPDSHKFFKDMVMERIKDVQGMVMESHECSEIIQTKIIPKKLGDPGLFTLPCSLGTLAFSNCLCDLGAFKSLMPLSVAKRLGFSTYKPCNITLILADESIRFPHGLLEDLPIKIGNAEIPTDFIVLEMDEPKDPLILGRPFLATAGAVIDVKNGKIDLNLGNDFKMKFDINDATRKPTIEGQTFVVKVMDCLADEQLEEVAEEDHQQTSLTKSGEAGYLLTETLSCGKSLDSHKEVAGSEVFKGLIGSKTEVKVAYEASSTHAQPTDSSIHLSKPTTRLENSSSTKHRDKLLESSNSAPDGWLELKERSKWQDKAIRELTDTVRELKDQIKKLHGIANEVPLPIKDVPNDEASTLVSAKGSEITSEWSIDYPVDQQEAYYEKRAIEYSTADLSREPAKPDDSSTCALELILGLNGARRSHTTLELNLGSSWRGKKSFKITQDQTRRHGSMTRRVGRQEADWEQTRPGGLDDTSSWTSRRHL